jgi:hypothetical protein
MKKILVLLVLCFVNYFCAAQEQGEFPWEEDPQHIVVQDSIFLPIAEKVVKHCSGGYHTLYLTGLKFFSVTS